MKHNERRLEQLAILTLVSMDTMEPADRVEAVSRTCRLYAEGINAELTKQLDEFRWRSVDETPDEGQRIECLCHGEHDTDIWNWSGNGLLDLKAYKGWRPFKGMGDEVVK